MKGNNSYKILANKCFIGSLSESLPREIETNTGSNSDPGFVLIIKPSGPYRKNQLFWHPVFEKEHINARSFPFGFAF